MRLDATELKRIQVWLSAGGAGPFQSLQLSLPIDEQRFSLSDLIDFVRETQPNGTAVEVWFQGRSERLVI